jgi:hypothetical protein
MKQETQQQRLQALRDALAHFHHTSEFGRESDVEIIKNFIALRIREAESLLRRDQWLQSEAA